MWPIDGERTAKTIQRQVSFVPLLQDFVLLYLLLLIQELLIAPICVVIYLLHGNFEVGRSFRRGWKVKTGPRRSLTQFDAFSTSSEASKEAQRLNTSE